MLSISNIYGHGFETAQIERLVSLGFVFREKVSTFAGAQILRFVDLAAGPALEFIEVHDDNAYKDFLPTGMTPYCPGVNLKVPRDSPTGLAPYQAKYHEWGANPRHVNYDGSDTPGRPGWNYLNFDQPVVEGTFVYLGCADDPQPTRPPPGRHPNGVTQVTELIFNLDEGGLAQLSLLAGRDMVDGGMDLAGVRVLAANSQRIELPFRAKKFPLAAVAVRADSLDFFKGRTDVLFTKYRSKPAVYIQTTTPSWDIIVT